MLEMQGDEMTSEQASRAGGRETMCRPWPRMGTWSRAHDASCVDEKIQNQRSTSLRLVVSTFFREEVKETA